MTKAVREIGLFISVVWAPKDFSNSREVVFVLSGAVPESVTLVVLILENEPFRPSSLFAKVGPVVVTLSSAFGLSVRLGGSVAVMFTLRVDRMPSPLLLLKVAVVRITFMLELSVGVGGSAGAVFVNGVLMPVPPLVIVSAIPPEEENRAASDDTAVPVIS